MRRQTEIKTGMRFVCAIKQAEQLAFDGVNRMEDIYASSCHVSYQGSIFCGTDKSKLKMKPGVVRISDTKLRPEGVAMCPECETKYKANGQLDWQKWIANVGKQTVS